MNKKNNSIVNIKTWIKYKEAYLPPRCRKVRYRECEKYVDIPLKKVSRKELVLAYEDKYMFGKGKIYRYKGSLWAKSKLTSICKELMWEKNIQSQLDWIRYFNLNHSWYFYREELDGDCSMERVLKRAKKDMSNRILVNSVIFEKTVKPEYFVQTFGVYGDGTGLFVCYPARRDCGWHFPATKGDEAVAFAKKIAMRRGDFDDTKRFKPLIVCY